MPNFKIKIYPQTILDISLICYLCSNAVRLVIYRIIGFSDFSYTITYILIYGLIAGYLVWTKRWFTKETMGILAGLLIYILLTCMIHPEYQPIFFEKSSSWQTDRIIFTQIFAATSGFTILPIICLYNKSEDFIRSMVIAVVINAIFSIFLYRTGNFSINISTITTNDTYSMSMGYSSLIPFCFLTSSAIKEKKMIKRVFYSILALIMLWMIIISGIRGALLCVVIFVYLYLMFCIDYKFKRIVIFFISIGAIVLGYLSLNSSFLMAVGGLLNRIGLSSRSITALINGVISNDNGRQSLQIKAIELIKSGGPFGSGFCASRYLYSGSYPHNLFLEMGIDMGYVGGSIFAFALLIGVVYFITHIEDNKWRIGFIIFFSCAMGKLFVSASFWADTLFWGTLAIGFAAVRSYKLEKKVSE